MADFSSLKQTIQTYIKQNGNEEITGNILQDVLLAIVSTMGDSAINSLASALQDEITARQNQDGTLQGNITAEATARQQADTALGGRIDGLQTAINGINTKLAEGYIYAGIATPSTNPGTPSGKVFYIAVSSGTYTNFSNLTAAQGINILKYNGSAWSKDVVYAIDARPKKNSQNLVSSGGVFDNIGALDVSELNATENPHTLAQYADLSAALAAIPTDYQKGGMSVKFVQSIDNKYIQYRLMATSFSTNEDDWQGVDDKPTNLSKNLIESGGAIRTFEKIDRNIELLDRSAITLFDYTISTNSGKLKNQEGFTTTPLVEVNPNDVLWVTAYYNRLYLYDVSNEYIGYIQHVVGKSIISYDPSYSNVKYVRTYIDTNLLDYIRIGKSPIYNIKDVDLVVTDNSYNLITSGAVYEKTNTLQNSINSLQQRITEVQSDIDGTTLALENIVIAVGNETLTDVGVEISSSSEFPITRYLYDSQAGAKDIAVNGNSTYNVLSKFSMNDIEELTIDVLRVTVRELDAEHSPVKNNTFDLEFSDGGISKYCKVTTQSTTKYIRVFSYFSATACSSATAILFKQILSSSITSDGGILKSIESDLENIESNQIECDNIQKVNKDNFINTPVVFQNDAFDALVKPSGQRIATKELCSLSFPSQCADAYGDYAIIIAKPNIHVPVLMNLKSWEVIDLSSIPNSTLTHCNSCAFSNTFYSNEDYFPLMYIADWDRNVIEVIRFAGNPQADNITPSVVQTINTPAFSSTMGYYINLLLDGANMWIMSYNSDTIATASNLLFHKFAVPAISNTTVNLSESDSIDSFTTDITRYFQDAFVKDGVAFVGFGNGNVGAYDLINKQLLQIVNIGSTNYESEGSFYWSNDMWLIRKDVQKNTTALWIVRFYKE